MKILKLLGLLIVLALHADFSYAENFVTFKGDVVKLKVTSFSDYMPFGYLNEKGRSDDKLASVFRKSLQEFLPKIGYKPVFESFETTDDALQSIHMGKINLFIGAYYSTHIYDDFEFAFPALLNNPVHLMMLPSRINEVHNVSDLKNLKGVYSTKEYFADYIIQKFEALNLKKLESEQEAYKALITGEADFILGSYYTNYIKVAQTGLKNYIAFSSKPLWNMPMFLALSKMTPNLKIVKNRLQKLLDSEEFKKDVIQSMKDYVTEIEQNAIGVVPPTYVNEQMRAQNTLTPADEQKMSKEE